MRPLCGGARANKDDSGCVAYRLQLLAHLPRSGRRRANEARPGFRRELEPVKIGVVTERIALVNDRRGGYLGEQRIPKSSAAK